MSDSSKSKQKVDPKVRRTLLVVFLTLFLDLVGFSIIFPMFPALAKYYLELDADNFFLRLIFDFLTSILTVTEASDQVLPVVLFGGVLGALYSLLQFICAPLWGGLSDRIGRKPVLFISVAGIALSYVLWFFAGSFTILVLARLVGGVMAGNISVATAAVSDVTDERTRTKGMALVGIAFALGFIVGPAIGGLLTLIDLTVLVPSLIGFGVNPFSAPALVAFLLSAINLVLIHRRFEETLRRSDQEQITTFRSNNPLFLFKPLPYAGVTTTNIAYFFFLLAFSGMEFTLTFLAVDRLGNTSLENGYMFIFVGLVLVLIQGGVVRRHGAKIGERKLALIGMVISIPGLVVLGFASELISFYLGLFLMASGSALIIPCLTSLVSLYTPSHEQGKAIGIFRSLGAFSRVLGPLGASMLYWKWGAASPYYLGAISLILPAYLITRLPALPQSKS